MLSKEDVAKLKRTAENLQKGQGLFVEKLGTSQFLARKLSALCDDYEELREKNKSLRDLLKRVRDAWYDDRLDDELLDKVETVL